MTDEKKSVDIASPSDVKGEAEVDENNPWGDDALERQKFEKPLTDLVSSARNAPFCIAVDGDWGSGKTFFLKRWREEFLKKGNKAIYFNAWEDDFYADPLTAIIGQLRKEIESPTLEEISNMCDSILKKTLIELLGKVLKGSGFEEKDLRTAVGGTVNEYLQARNTIEGLKQRLKTLAKDVRGEETKPPLVFIVDELDRCRPTFAIELLERVKHIVGVPGIVFVFGINQKELEKSIQSVYGDINAADYLRRFFDTTMTLPQAKAPDYCRYLISKHNITKAIAESAVHQTKYGTGWSGDWQLAIEKMPEMVGYMRLSLRQIEQAVRMVLVVLRSKEVAEQKRMYRFEGLLLVFILLRIKAPNVYQRFINGNCAVKDAMDDILSFLPWEDSRERSSSWGFCIHHIIFPFYFFYSDGERKAACKELIKISDAWEEHDKPKVCNYVPQKIVEMKNGGTQQQLARELHPLIGRIVPDNVGNDFPHLVPRQIARLLEWGDYWQE